MATFIPELSDLNCDVNRALRRKNLMLEDDILHFKSMTYRKRSGLANFLFIVFSVCTASLLAIVMNWPSFARARHIMLSRPSTPEEADLIIVDTEDGYFEACPIEEIRAIALESMGFREARRNRKPLNQIPSDRRMFVFRHTRFLHRGEGKYVQLSADEALLPDGRRVLNGHDLQMSAAQLELFGRNLVDVPIPPIPILLLKECVHPFIIFQLWAVIVWCNQAYYSFAAFIFATAILSAILNLVELLSNLREIRRLAHFEEEVTVRSYDAETGKCFVIKKSSAQLAPGDVIVLNEPCKVPADIVLIQGGASVTEAMLTGEVTVVSKSNINVPLHFTPAETSRLIRQTASLKNTVFMGTQIVAPRAIQGKDVIGVVVRTGYESVKGRLILSILYPKAPAFKFFAQSMKFISILGVLAVLGFILNAFVLRDQGESWGVVVQRGLDMVTIVVPPALPLAITAGILFALAELKKKHGVYCISPDRINLAGKVNSIIFDKTGTLTEDSLDLQCVVCTTPAKPSVPATFAPETGALKDTTTIMKALLALCQSLVEIDGKPAGDPLEVKTFEFSEATSKEIEVDGETTAQVTVELKAPVTMTINRTFEFTPQLQRMGTLVSVPADARAHFQTTSNLVAFHKGAPEVIERLCDPNSVPANFHDVLNKYTSAGLRVLAAAYTEVNKKSDSLPASADIDAMNTLRTECEQNLVFLGFIVLINRLKAPTKETIERLHSEAQVRMCMATGDNAVTAVAVARECALVPENHNVFIGDVYDGRVIFKNMDDTSAELDFDNLAPIHPRDQTMKYSLALTGKALGHLAEAALAEISNTSGDKVAATGSSVDTHQLFNNLEYKNDRTSPKLQHLYRILMNTRVLARMTPENKALVVGLQQNCGLYVLMVGDGANDSMALKQAHVGLSLSLVEASVAASFTSHIPDISNVIPLLLEGRGALALGFAMFQFMALYSTIQFCNALCIVFKASFLSNNEYLWQDLFIVLVLAVALGWTKSTKVLTKKRPSGRLSSGTNLILVALFIGLTIVAQLIGYRMVKEQDFYINEEVPLVSPEELNGEGTNSWIPEAATVFIIANFQYIGCAIIFPALAMPWKRFVLTNEVFSFWMTFIVVGSFYMGFAGEKGAWLYEWLSIHPDTPAYWFRACSYIGLISFCTYFIVIGGFMYLKRNTTIFRCGKSNRILPLHKVYGLAWIENLASLEDRPEEYLNIVMAGSQDTKASHDIKKRVYKGFVNDGQDEEEEVVSQDGEFIVQPALSNLGTDKVNNPMLMA